MTNFGHPSGAPAASVTKKLTDRPAAGRASAQAVLRSHSLRDLVLYVGRFRKIHLVQTDSSKSLLEGFVEELCATADASGAGSASAANSAATAQKIAALKARL